MKNRQMQALLAGPGGLGAALRVGRGRRSMQQLADALASITPEGSDVGKWSSSKVSKIETGQQLPSAIEVSLWADAAGVDGPTRKHWLELQADADSKRSMYRRRTPASASTVTARTTGLEFGAALTRVLQHAVIPDLLQVEEYHRAIWAPDHTDQEIDEFVEELRERQATLHAPEKRFQFLIGEAALRTIRGSHAVMATQLDRLISASSLATVTIGILPLGVLLRGPFIPVGFTLYDQDHANIDDAVGGYQYGGISAGSLRERLDAAWEDAVEGRAARKLILGAIDALDLD